MDWQHGDPTLWRKVGVVPRRVVAAGQVLLVVDQTRRFVLPPRRALHVQGLPD